jgi:hypothetical protein
MGSSHDVIIVYTEVNEIPYCFTLEQRFLKEFKDYRYIPKIKFKGYTECLKVNPVEEYFND